MDPSPASRGHTQRYLRELLAKRGLHARSSLGQCFLVDLNLIDLILDRAELAESDFVLEVGTGTGSLTKRLAAQAQTVLSVEIDPKFYLLARETIGHISNVALLNVDVLKNKNTLNPEVIAAISEASPEAKQQPRKLVANLPYKVATPVISLLLTSSVPWERFVVTVQKEFADRILARPATRDYGSISVLVQALAEVELVRDLPATVFWPQPKVSSALVVIRPVVTKRESICDLHRFHRFVREVMRHRRKILRRAIAAMLPHVKKPEIDQFLESQSIDPKIRADSLTVGMSIKLAASLPAGWLS